MTSANTATILAKTWVNVNWALINKFKLKIRWKMSTRSVERAFETISTNISQDSSTSNRWLPDDYKLCVKSKLDRKVPASVADVHRRDRWTRGNRQSPRPYPTVTAFCPLHFQRLLRNRCETYIHYTTRCTITDWDSDFRCVKFMAGYRRDAAPCTGRSKMAAGGDCIWGWQRRYGKTTTSWAETLFQTIPCRCVAKANAPSRTLKIKITDQADCKKYKLGRTDWMYYYEEQTEKFYRPTTWYYMKLIGYWQVTTSSFVLLVHDTL